MTIDRSYETMSSKERFLRTINYEKPDRVPINYKSNVGIDLRLKQYFGLPDSDNEGLLEKLGVDFRAVGAEYTGKPLHTTNAEKRKVHPEFGWVLRYIEHNSGGYWDYCDFPLINATEEEVENWKFPNPNDYDYDELNYITEEKKDYALYLGNPGLGCIINNIGFLRGMEQALIDLITDEPAGILLIEKFMNFQLKKLERELEAVGDKIDFIWMGEDLGTQHAPLINRDIFLKHILPYHKNFFNLAKAYKKPVMMHTCGSSSWAYEDYINAGLSGVETLQPEAKDMSPRYLKDNFGGRLFFHGCISTAGSIAFGTVAETTIDCINVLDIMKPGYGYIFSPTHAFQDNSKNENIVAAYNTAHSYGRY